MTCKPCSNGPSTVAILTNNRLRLVLRLPRLDMATFSNYGGVDLDLDWFISYARVSSPQQTLENRGAFKGSQKLLCEGHRGHRQADVCDHRSCLPRCGRSRRANHN